MKIVFISDVFFPDSGYSEVIFPKYWSSFGHKVWMITSQLDKVPDKLTSFFGKEKIEERDNLYKQKYGVEVIRVPLVSYFSGRAIFNPSIFKLVRKINPDIVVVGGNDSLIGIQMTLRYSREKYGLVMDSHMLEMASQNRFRKIFRFYYKKFITPKILKNKLTVIRMQDDSYVEKALGIPLTHAPFISFGSDLMLFHPDSVKKREMREKMNIDDNAFVITYAGKLDEEKGGVFLAETLLKKFSTDKELVFLVIGNTAGACKERTEELLSKSENRIIRIPTQKYEALASYYQMSDIAVFPKQCSLSFYDVQACGLPVIFEDNSVNCGRADHDNALVFKSGDVCSFRDRIYEFIKMSKDELSKYSENSYHFINEKYNYKDKAMEYISYMEKEVEKKKNG